MAYLLDTNNKLTLVTDNVTDFQNIEDIKIENWFKRK